MLHARGQDEHITWTGDDFLHTIAAARTKQPPLGATKLEGDTEPVVVVPVDLRIRGLRYKHVAHHVISAQAHQLRRRQGKPAIVTRTHVLIDLGSRSLPEIIVKRRTNNVMLELVMVGECDRLPILRVVVGQRGVLCHGRIKLATMQNELPFPFAQTEARQSGGP